VYTAIFSILIKKVLIDLMQNKKKVFQYNIEVNKCNIKQK